MNSIQRAEEIFSLLPVGWGPWSTHNGNRAGPVRPPGAGRAETESAPQASQRGPFPAGSWQCLWGLSCSPAPLSSGQKAGSLCTTLELVSIWWQIPRHVLGTGSAPHPHPQAAPASWAWATAKPLVPPTAPASGNHADRPLAHGGPRACCL